MSENQTQKTEEKTLDQLIIKAVSDQISSPEFTKLIADTVQAKIKNTVENIFNYNSPLNNVIKKKLEEFLVPNIEAYDMSKYAEKLNIALDEVLAQSALSQTGNILRNFKGLMCEDVPGEIKVSELFERYQLMVARYVDTTKLEVAYDEPAYESPTLRFEVETKERWLDKNNPEYHIRFICEEDETLNRELRCYTIDRSKENEAGRKMGYLWMMDTDIHITDLRYMKDFDLYVFMLRKRFSYIDIDELEGECDDIDVMETPEMEM